MGTKRQGTKDDRAAEVGERERAVRAAEGRVEAREAALSAREAALGAREAALAARQAQPPDRQGDERLLAQTREANEQLLLASMRAEDLAERADAARAEVAKDEERFRSLVTTSAAMVWRADATGRRLECPGWSAFTGLPDEPGDDWLAAVHSADRARVLDDWKQAIARRSGYSVECRLRRHDGSHAWVLVRAVPIPEPPVPVREWVGTITDLSDRKRIEEAREQFISILGHDLRTPLSAIMLLLETLARASDLQQQYVLTALRGLRSAHRMEAMIRDLLDFARGRLGGGIPITPQGCNLARICADAVEEMRGAHPDRAIDCETTGDLGGQWDGERLGQALSNLIANAVQHGEDPIRVIAHPADDQSGEVVVAVHNQGPPIPVEAMARLFEPYFSGERGTAKGLGLGLYIASEIVRAHGGSISARSMVGEGTTFTVVLPRFVAARGRDAPRSSAPGASAAQA